MTRAAPPVIAIDGPSASGKGTIAARVAAALGFRYLDSGALYRVLALDAMERGIGLDDESALAGAAAALDIAFDDGELLLRGRVVGDRIRAEDISAAASRVAAFGPVRAALLQRQRDFRTAPGLVAEGRDMATVVFPDALLKVFLTASAEVRAQRRHKQLIDKGLGANIATLLQEIRERDARDANRVHAPLEQAADAVLLDTSALTIDEAVRRVIDLWNEAG